MNEARRRAASHSAAVNALSTTMLAPAVATAPAHPHELSPRLVGDIDGSSASSTRPAAESESAVAATRATMSLATGS